MHVNNVFELIGVIVPLLSTLASFFNGKVRAQQAAGAQVSPLVAKAGAVLNVGALNFDKALQLAKLVKEVLPQQEAPAEKQGE